MIRRIIHVEMGEFEGTVYKTHSFRPPNLSKKKTRRRPERRYLVEWKNEIHPPKTGWHNLDSMDTMEVIFSK